MNVVKSRKINQINKNSTIKIAANFVEELNQRNENSNTKKKEGIQHTEARLGESLKNKMRKQNNVWPVYWKYK